MQLLTMHFLSCALSTGLIISQVWGRQDTRQKDSFQQFTSFNSDDLSSHEPNAGMSLLAGGVGAWPALPYTFDTGFQLQITVTQLGFVATQA